MNEFLHFKSTTEAVQALHQGLTPTAEALGIVVQIRAGGRCDVDARVGSGRSIITARVAPIMEEVIQTGQFVRLSDEGHYGRDVTARMSSSYHIPTRRFYTVEEIAREESKAAKARTREKCSEGFQRRFNTPLKRISLLVMLFGVLMTFIGLAVAVADAGSYRTIDKVMTVWWNSLTGSGSSYRRSALLGWGTYLAIAGAILSFAYEPTVGRLLHWIRSGETRRPSR